MFNLTVVVCDALFRRGCALRQPGVDQPLGLRVPPSPRGLADRTPGRHHVDHSRAVDHGLRSRVPCAQHFRSLVFA